MSNLKEAIQKAIDTDNFQMAGNIATKARNAGLDYNWIMGKVTEANRKPEDFEQLLYEADIAPE